MFDGFLDCKVTIFSIVILCCSEGSQLLLKERKMSPPPRGGYQLGLLGLLRLLPHTCASENFANTLKNSMQNVGLTFLWFLYL